MPKHRTQVLLEESEYQEIARCASRQDVSVSQFIRSTMKEKLEADSKHQVQGLQAMRGLFSDPSLSGRDHDAEIYS